MGGRVRPGDGCPCPADRNLSNADINDSGQSTFQVSGGPLSPPNTGTGVYRFDPATASATLLVGTSLIGGLTPWINNSGEVGVFYRTPDEYRSYGSDPGDVTIHAREGVDYSVLNAPRFDKERRLTGVVRVGPPGSGAQTSRPDQLRRFLPDATSEILAEDRDSNPASIIGAFDALAPGVSDSGDRVAFIASLTSSRRVLVHDGSALSIVPTPPLFRELVADSPAINESGLVAFRAIDVLDREALYLSDGVTATRLFGIGDTIATDLGPKTVTALGTPDINNRGDVVFAATVDANTTVIIAAYVPEPGVASILAPALLALGRRRVGPEARH